MSQLLSKRVQPNAAPVKLAPRKSQAINLAPRRSAPEKSHSLSEVFTNCVSLRSAFEKSILLNSQSWKVCARKRRFSCGVKTACNWPEQRLSPR